MTYRTVPPLSLRHGLAVIAGCFLLAGCGFHPMYGSSTAPALSSIYVEPIAERDGYELRNTLIDALQSDGDKAGKAYSLKVTLNESSQGIALQNDATITRYNNRLEAHYTLSDMKGNVLTSGSQIELSAYNVVQSPYATLTAQQDSSKRAAQDVAERIHLDLGVWFRKQKK
ncbi:MAG TPA: LPS assembly lipoprotein LptE [Rhizomicrobium sp.]|jgi:LPS-assembly lipoprotein|nr:LPS assembly lipoprotein LptE [Rhizomicrobium sp.]